MRHVVGVCLRLLEVAAALFEVCGTLGTARLIVVVVAAHRNIQLVCYGIAKTLAQVIGAIAHRHGTSGLVALLVNVVYLPVIGLLALVGCV